MENLVKKRIFVYTVVLGFDLFFINYLFKQITSCMSANLFVIATSALMTLFTYKLCMFLFKFAFLKADSDTNLSYLNRFVFENEYLYKLLVTKKSEPSYQQALYKTTGQVFSLTHDAEESDLEIEIKSFTSKLSENFLQSWYNKYVSINEDFPDQAKMQLEFLLADIFTNFTKINKTVLCQDLMFTFNENFLNISRNHLNSKDSLHQALQNLPKSEIDYMKDCIQLILQKSYFNSKTLSDAFINEFVLQVIGKNCLEKLINSVTQPSFIFYSIIILCGDTCELEKTTQKNEKQPDFPMNKTPRQVSRLSTDIQDTGLELPAFDFDKIDIEKESDTETESDLHSLFYDFKESTEDLNEERVSESDSVETSSKGCAETASIIENDGESSRFYHNDIGSMCLSISNTETDYDSKTGTPYTLFNVKVNKPEKTQKSKKISI
jgi:hypothetical protein